MLAAHDFATAYDDAIVALRRAQSALALRVPGRERLQGLLDGWLADHRECLTFGDFAVEYLARLEADRG